MRLCERCYSSFNYNHDPYCHLRALTRNYQSSPRRKRLWGDHMKQFLEYRGKKSKTKGVVLIPGVDKARVSELSHEYAQMLTGFLQDKVFQTKKSSEVVEHSIALLFAMEQVKASSISTLEGLRLCSNLETMCETFGKGSRISYRNRATKLQAELDKMDSKALRGEAEKAKLPSPMSSPGRNMYR